MREREAARAREQAKEEMYDRMMNPHLYGGAGGVDHGGGGAYRPRVKRGEHYEVVQKKELERTIREREADERARREREDRLRRERRFQHDQRQHHYHHYQGGYQRRPPPPHYYR